MAVKGFRASTTAYWRGGGGGGMNHRVAWPQSCRDEEREPRCTGLILDYPTGYFSVLCGPLARPLCLAVSALPGARVKSR